MNPTSSLLRASKRFRSWRVMPTLGLILAIAVFALVTLPAAAQTPSPIPGTAFPDTVTPLSTPSATTVVIATPSLPGSVATTSRPVPPPQQFIQFAVAALLFALASVISVLVYTYQTQSRFYDVAEHLGRSGKTIRVVSGPTPFTGSPADFMVRDAETPPGPPLTIEGPAAVSVGVESSEFRAMLGEKPAANAIWKVEPENSAIVIPPSGGEKVTVVAATATALTLIATIVGPPEKIAKLRTVAINPQSAAIELPFVGRGYGSITIAIVLIAAVLVLAVAGILDGEGTAALLGGLLGYIFGVGVSTTAKKPESEQS